MKKLYSVEREYPVAVSTLWDAWMNADALASWYSPTDLKVVAGSVTSEHCWWLVDCRCGCFTIRFQRLFLRYLFRAGRE